MSANIAGNHEEWQSTKYGGEDLGEALAMVFISRAGAIARSLGHTVASARRPKSQAENWQRV